MVVGERDRPLTEIIRSRIRARAAELYLTHDEIAARLKRISERLGRPMPTSRSKVNDAIRGRTPPRLDELRVWAEALETSEEYLLGFTWDPQPVLGSSDDRTTLDKLSALETAAA